MRVDIMMMIIMVLMLFGTYKIDVCGCIDDGCISVEPVVQKCFDVTTGNDKNTCVF